MGRDPEVDLRLGRCPESERPGVAVWLEKERVAVRCPGLGAFTDWKAVTSIFWLLVAGSYTTRIHTHQPLLLDIETLQHQGLQPT